MKLLIVLFISSMLVLSIGCASQDDGDVAELVKEVQLLREEVDQLRCHLHEYSYRGSMVNNGMTEFPRIFTTEISRNAAGRPALRRTQEICEDE